MVAGIHQSSLVQAGMRPSMSRKGTRWDSAPTESLWSTLKQKLIRDRVYLTRADAEAEIREYLEIFDSRQRRHSSAGNVPPTVFANRSFKQRRVTQTTR